MFIRATIGTAVTLEAPNNCRAVGEWLFSAVSELGMESGWYIGRQDTLGDGGSRGEKHH